MPPKFVIILRVNGVLANFALNYIFIFYHSAALIASSELSSDNVARASSSNASSLSLSLAIRLNRFITLPVPAGTRRPTITFSFNPSKLSTFPETAASVSTRVVSWNDAADMNDLVCKDAFVIPWRTGLALATASPCASAFSLASSNSSLSTAVSYTHLTLPTKA